MTQDIRMRGVVKFYSPDKEFGFITAADDGKDYFVHIGALKAAGLTSQEFGKGDPVEFVPMPGKDGKGPRAAELKRV